MRPRFQLELPFNRAELRRRMDARLACTSCPCQAMTSERHVEVLIRKDLQHSWSPRLSLEIEDAGEDRTLLQGCFGPNPHMWTFFMMVYSTLGCAAIFAALLGASQLTMGASPWGLWIAGMALALMVLPYLASLHGQRLATDQMSLLNCFLEESLGLDHRRVTGPGCPD
jgi:hypothetical protein